MHKDTMDGTVENLSESLYGRLSPQESLVGALTGTNPIEGSLEGELLRGYSAYDIAVRHGYTGTEEEWLEAIQGLKIHKQTKASWDSQPDLVAQANHIYIYTDYYSYEDGEGNVKLRPAIKIGDGTSFLIDLPSVGGADIALHALQLHAQNTQIHASPVEKSDWNRRVKARFDDETLILYA